ncbi:MAG: Rieske 2Fe-2S domain-containing protein [Nitrospinota bacterium]
MPRTAKGISEVTVWPALAHYWHPVAYSHEITDKPFPSTVLGEQIVVCRLGEKTSAFSDLCIHRGTPMSLGRIEGEQIVCAYHGWSYDAEGKCTRIPSIPPDHPIPKKARLTRYPAHDRYGMVWVCLSDEPRAPIPEYPAYEDLEYHVVIRDSGIWKCGAARAIENFIDLAHFSWIHEGILGDREHTLTPEMITERRGEVLHFHCDCYPDRLHPVSHRRNYRLARPFSIYNWKEEPDGRHEVLVFTCTPHAESECTWFFMIARNYDPDPGKGEGEGQENLYKVILEQDQAIVERQRPEALPLDLTEELHVKGPDAIALEYRRFLGELGVDVK